jgi:hypothetical protein
MAYIPQQVHCTGPRFHKTSRGSQLPVCGAALLSVHMTFQVERNSSPTSCCQLGCLLLLTALASMLLLLLCVCV